MIFSPYDILNITSFFLICSFLGLLIGKIIRDRRDS